MMSEDKKEGAVKKAARRVKEHAARKKDFRLPNWLSYVILIIGALAVIYGVIQQARIVRWKKILRASEIQISELRASHDKVALEATKKCVESQRKVNHKKLKKINRDIKKIEAETKRIKIRAGRMGPIDLMNAFRSEGFVDDKKKNEVKKKEEKQDGEKDSPKKNPPVRRTGCSLLYDGKEKRTTT